MENFSQYIALFTAPAVKSSRKLFLEYGIYIFSNHAESGFKESIFNQATHIGLGERYQCEGDENSFGKYVKIVSVGEIIEIGSFEIEFVGGEVTEIKDNSSVILNDECLQEYMQKFMENSIFCKDNWEFSSSTEKKWKFIYVKPDGIRNIEENILYPSKEIVSLPLNLDGDGNYIPSHKLIKTIKYNSQYAVDNERRVIIDIHSGKEIKIGSYNEEYTDILVNLIKFPEGYFLEKHQDLKNGLKIDYKKLQDLASSFNDAKFSKILGLKIHIATNARVTIEK